MKHTVYLDHAAATPMYENVWEKWNTIRTDLWANPSSIHHMGQRVRGQIDHARFECAKLFDTEASNIIFTSGGTEAAHLAIIGGYLILKNPQKRILVSPIAHACIWGALDFLASIRDIDIVTIPIDTEGFFDLSRCTPEFLASFDLVIADHGNSEIGVLQDISELGKCLEAVPKENRPLSIIDVAASILTEDIELSTLYASMVFISGEKFGGPKGTGLLALNENVEIQSLQRGTQELGLRGGTENTEGILCLTEALKTHQTHKQNIKKHFTLLNTYLRKRIPTDYTITTPTHNNLSHILHCVSQKGSGQMFVMKADLKGVCVSAGAACSSGAVQPSRVLKALGFSDQKSHNGIRISFGRNTTTDDIDRLLECF